MYYRENKVYFDGSHYIAIPHSEGKKGKCHKKKEQLIEVKENEEQSDAVGKVEEQSITESEGADIESAPDLPCREEKVEKEKKAKVRRMTKKELFEELYKQNLNVSYKERKAIIVESMLPYFDTREAAEFYVTEQLDRKLRNLICRRTRLIRKINLHEFNYFCTFTYDDNKHSEESFKKKLRTCLRHFTERKNWQYAGVWERSPENQRLHFHGLFDIPEGTMPGEIIEVNDWSSKEHRRQITHQNTYFNERFGRSDFETIDTPTVMGESIQYLIKYIEKTGERIVYSKGLPQFFITDIMDDDVACPYGQEDKKLLLFDDFNCWEEGVLIGKVSKETIKQLRKAN